MNLNHTLNRKPFRSLQLLSAAALALASLAHAQETAPTPQTLPQTLEDALHQLSDAAGVVFVGEVVAIRHREGANGSSGVVEVDFRVDQAVRGCTAGGIYTLREWAGLWSGGDQRYRIGQRLLMLLHTPGASGMTSPVGGMDGAIPIRGAATELAPRTAATNATLATANSITAAATQAKVATASAPPVADLRWVGTRVLRHIDYQAPATHRTATATTATSAKSQTAASASDASTAAQQAPVSIVVNMLSVWQEATHAAQ